MLGYHENLTSNFNNMQFINCRDSGNSRCVLHTYYFLGTASLLEIQGETTFRLFAYGAEDLALETGKCTQNIYICSSSEMSLDYNQILVFIYRLFVVSWASFSASTTCPIQNKVISAEAPVTFGAQDNFKRKAIVLCWAVMTSVLASCFQWSWKYQKDSLTF